MGLGTDSAGLNTNQDLLEEMRIAGILQRGSFLDPTVLPTQKLLEMTTVDAAKTLMNSEIGSIEVGKKADIAVIDFRKPHLRPNHTRIVSHLVWAAYASDVITTIVDGQVLMENRILQKLDEQSILEKVDRLAEQLLERVGYHENTTWNWE